MKKEISNPFSTSGGGAFFEVKVQTAFVILMLTGGIVPCLRAWPIVKIKLQGKYAGYDTDDFIVFTKEPSSGRSAKLLAQIKHSVAFTDRNKNFGDTIAAAWSDFKNPKVFDPTFDAIVLITGPMSFADIDNVRFILERARHCEDASDFFTQIDTAKFSSNTKRAKLNAFHSQLVKANSGNDLSDEELWHFLRAFHVLGYDLDVKAGVTLSLVKSHLSQTCNIGVDGLWSMVFEEVTSFNQNAGTVTKDNIGLAIRDALTPPAPQVEPLPEVIAPRTPGPTGASPFVGAYALSLMFASLLGSWDGKAEGDISAIDTLLNDEC